MGSVFVIGIAGGIGSGKSTVASEFAKLGAEVLDADEMVHELLRTRPIIGRIARRFGKDVLKRTGGIDRAKLAQRTFTDERTIRSLENILHPQVIRRTKKRIAALRREKGHHVVVIDAPLLFEAGMDALCDSVLYVQAARKLREQRLKRTRGWKPIELKRREKRQKSLHYKRRNAEFVIRNDLSRRDTAAQVRKLWQLVQGRLQP